MVQRPAVVPASPEHQSFSNTCFFADTSTEIIAFLSVSVKHRGGKTGERCRGKRAACRLTAKK
ncbi:hypothetical protein CBW42_10770 [Butyricicoccus porcorum]|uniref:Uncharacterized protein n=1 Tax=Butyricicoccus porcorum TaxID=1945634 RepID=A0A252F2C9_9FIRM|nr:hypothetical protein CBW42_10770 [Butyricicoccus porcorum]